MATNYVQEGEVLDLTAPYAVSAGDGAQVGSVFGVAVNDLAISEVGPFARCGVFDLAALSTATGAQGAKAYWDNSNKRVDTDGTVGILIGFLLDAKTNGQTTARVVLNEAVVGMSEGPQPAIAALTDSTGGSGTHDDTLADGLTAVAVTDNSGGVDPGDNTIAVVTNAAAVTDNSGGVDPGDNTIASITNANNAGSADVAPTAAAIAQLTAKLNVHTTAITALKAAVAQLAAKHNVVVTDLTTQNQNDSDEAQKILEIRTALIAAGIIAAA